MHCVQPNIRLQYFALGTASRDLLLQVFSLLTSALLFPKDAKISSTVGLPSVSDIGDKVIVVTGDCLIATILNVTKMLVFFSEIRETRDGWPLLTVETEVNGDSKSTN